MLKNRIEKIEINYDNGQLLSWEIKKW